MFGLAVVGTVVVVALFAPLLAPHDFSDQQLPKVLLPPFWQPRADPAYPLGTDHLGRDLLSRIIFGARTSLLVGGGGVLIAGTLGISLGLLAGYFGRAVDDVIMRLVDVQLSFPPIFLVIAIMAVIGQSLLNVVLVLGLVTWVQYARVVRGATLSVKEKDFVEGARAAGAGHARILVRHILPNIVAPLLVQGTYVCGSAMITEAILSFIGAGTPPNIPSWGNIMAEGRSLIQIAGYLIIFPGICLSLTVLAVNLLGDGMRDALDPRLARRM